MNLLSYPLLAFDLLSPAMLGWLAAATVPWLIHLWSRRRYREMSFAAMEYLLAAMRASRRRVRLEQWLLLLVRTLIVVVVVLAVAEPVLNRGTLSGFVAGEPTHRVLVIDGSYSMGYRPVDKSRFDRAREVARRIVEESSQGDGFTLVMMGSPPEVVVPTPVFQATDFLEELHALQLGHGSIDVPRTLARVEEILTAARREQTRLRREEVYFLTDLQRVGWELGGEARRAVQTRVARMAESAALVLVDLGQTATENLAVTDLSVVQPTVSTGQPVEIVALIEAFGQQGRSRRTVELFVDGRRAAQEPVDVTAEGGTSVAFTYRFATEGDHAVEVRLEEDALPVDDHRYLAVPVRSTLRVLCVDGRPSGDPAGGATGYLFLALAPSGPSTDGGSTSDGPGLQVEEMPESVLIEGDLRWYDVIFLADVAQFTPAEARRLERYLQGGGNLVFFLGPRVRADRYNDVLGGSGTGKKASGEEPLGRILPAVLGEVVESPRFRIDPLDYRHPIIRPFRGRPRTGLLSTPVHGYYRLLPAKDSLANVVAKLDDGSPLIVEEPIGRGRVVLVATSADVTWTSMPVWPSFVPIVQELVAFTVGGERSRRNVSVGDVIGDVLSAAAINAPLSVQSPDGQTHALHARGEGDDAVWSLSQTRRSGIYRARLGPPLERTDLFAANVDTVESDLERLAPETVREEVFGGIDIVHRTDWEEGTRAPVSAILRSTAWPRGLLHAALLLLLFETYLAWRMGYPGP